MGTRLKKRISRVFEATALLFPGVIDQLLKLFVRQGALKGYSNPGLAGQLLASRPKAALMINLMALIALLLLFFLRKQKGTTKIGVLMIISGATSNLYDRILYGAVFDYINTGVAYTFNLADVSIGIGIAYVLTTLMPGKARTTN